MGGDLKSRNFFEFTRDFTLLCHHQQSKYFYELSKDARLSTKETFFFASIVGEYGGCVITYMTKLFKNISYILGEIFLRNMANTFENRKSSITILATLDFP